MHASIRDENVCTQCRRSIVGRRIDWRFIGEELRVGVLSMERGLLFTLRALVAHPGSLLRDYLAGHRARYVKPLWLLVTSAALVTVVNHYIPGAGAIGQSGSGVEDAAPAADAENLLATYRIVSDWMYANLGLSTLLFLPLEAAFLRLSFFGVRGLNYPEWLTITAFLTVQTFILWTIGILLRGVFPAAEAWAIPAALVYMVASLVLTFDGIAWWKTALRGSLGLALYIVASQVVLAGATLVVLRASAA